MGKVKKLAAAGAALLLLKAAASQDALEAASERLGELVSSGRMVRASLELELGHQQESAAPETPAAAAPPQTGAPAPTMTRAIS